ncbi:MAG: extracellular solute-binding protein [Anaerolineae bacterium]
MEGKRRLTRRSFFRGSGVLAAGAALAACGATATPQAVQETVATGVTVAVETVVAVASPAAQSPVTVSWWTPPLWALGVGGNTPDAPPDAWVKDAVARYQESHPGVTIDAQVIPWGEWNQKVLTSFATQSWPNLVYRGLTTGDTTAAGNMALNVDAGIVAPIDDIITGEDKEDIGKADWDLCAYKGQIWSWPLFTDPSILVINKSIFQEKGVEDLLPKEPERKWTYEDFLTAAKAVTYSTSGGSEPDVYGLGLSGDSQFYFSMGYMLLAYGGKKYSKDGLKVLFDDPLTIEYLEFMKALQDEHKVMVPNLPPGNDVKQYFYDKKVAMRMWWCGIASEIESGLATGKIQGPFELMFLGSPNQPDVPYRRHAGANELTLMQTPDPGTLRASGDFLRFLTDTENSKAWKQGGFFPTRKSAGQGLFDDPNFVWVTDNLLPLEDCYWDDQAGGMNPKAANALADAKIDDMVQNVWQLVMLGKATPEEALGNAAAEANAALEVALSAG